MKTFLSPLLRKPQADMCLRNCRNGRIVARSLTGAFDSATRRQGLLGKSGLDEGHALIIAPTQAVHTFFMKFAIDVAFVRKDGRIVKVASSVGPWRLAASLRAFAVIELPSGALEAADTRADDVLRVEAA